MTIARLIWNTRDYECGLDHGVFYPKDGPGEAWNGLTSIIESTSSDIQTRYMDGIKTHNRYRPEDFSGSIEALSYPDSLYKDVFRQSRRIDFGLSYRVKSGDGYKIHLVYNILVLPSSYDYGQSSSNSFSWPFTTKPLAVPNAKASAHVVIDTNQAYFWTVAELEDILYGNETESARLPSPEEILDIFEDNALLKVIDHGDGSFTVTGPDSAIQMLDSTTFEITWPSAVYIDGVTYKISSL